MPKELTAVVAMFTTIMRIECTYVSGTGMLEKQSSYPRKSNSFEICML